MHLEVGDATDNVKCNLTLWISSSRVLLRALQMVLIVDENIFEKITKRNILSNHFYAAALIFLAP